MTVWTTLDLADDGRGIVTVTLNRPEARNALSAAMISELTHMARSVGAARSTRVIILRGAGPVFCAGGDLRWMQDQIKADRATRIAEARKLADMLRALNEMPCPLIGAIHGGAFGGGVGLACVCDVALSLPDCRFGLTETRLGLIPATIAPYVLARMGEGAARQVFMSSRLFSATEAKELGVVSRIVPEAQLSEQIEAEAAPYLSTSGSAVAAAKAMARSLGPDITDAVIDASIARLADVWETPDAAEGIAAFLEKRRPDWS
ncbi:crotonase/enoyl-CoA hydratase family protein (plasmid) [Rhodobacteraceae bacterium SC52]|nr:crotonase/enoyl-CoA hydratase family protein [Rhodobacteraceae bacterium SC52]